MVLSITGFPLMTQNDVFGTLKTPQMRACANQKKKHPDSKKKQPKSIQNKTNKQPKPAIITTLQCKSIPNQENQSESSLNQKKRPNPTRIKKKTVQKSKSNIFPWMLSYFHFIAFSTINSKKFNF